MRVTTVLAITVVGYAWGGFVTTQESSVTLTNDGTTRDAAKAFAAELKAKCRGTIEGQPVAFGDLQQIFDVHIEETVTSVEQSETARGSKTVTTTIREELVDFDSEDSRDTVDRANFPEAYQDEPDEEEAEA